MNAPHSDLFQGPRSLSSCDSSVSNVDSEIVLTGMKTREDKGSFEEPVQWCRVYKAGQASFWLTLHWPPLRHLATPKGKGGWPGHLVVSPGQRGNGFDEMPAAFNHISQPCFSSRSLFTCSFEICNWYMETCWADSGMLFLVIDWCWTGDPSWYHWPWAWQCWSDNTLLSHHYTTLIFMWNRQQKLRSKIALIPDLLCAID